MRQKLAYGLLLGILSLNIAGCFSARPEDIEAYIKPYEANVTAENYVCQPADQLQIQCPKVPDIHLQTQQIRPDGKISLVKYGEIEVAGKTPKEIAGILEEKISEEYKLIGDNPVNIYVAAIRSKHYYVIGEVSSPGARIYTGRDTAMNAIAGANPAITAWEEKIQVVRPSQSEHIKPKIFELNYVKLVKHGDATKDVLLEEGDIIYVPPTPLAMVGNVLAEIVRPIGLALSPIRQVSQISTGGGI